MFQEHADSFVAIMEELLDIAIEAALKGSEEILEVYGREFVVEQKEDYSPLTEADKRAHEAISGVLESTGLPILSEEGKLMDYDNRKEWSRFWMVDPLDGTKEFVKRNGEFTVNIALIENGDPVMGVIHVPVSDVLYLGASGKGSFKVDKAATIKGKKTYEWIAMAKTLPMSSDTRPYTVVASRSHLSVETSDFIKMKEEEHGNVAIASMGSSLKICLVAEGAADVYPRYAPTMEWDTAAGHAIAMAAGKQIIDYTTGEPMRYNKENLLNNWFTVE